MAVRSAHATLTWELREGAARATSGAPIHSVSPLPACSATARRPASPYMPPSTLPVPARPAPPHWPDAAIWLYTIAQNRCAPAVACARCRARAALCAACLELDPPRPVLAAASRRQRKPCIDGSQPARTVFISAMRLEELLEERLVPGVAISTAHSPPTGTASSHPNIPIRRPLLTYSVFHPSRAVRPRRASPAAAAVVPSLLYTVRLRDTAASSASWR